MRRPWILLLASFTSVAAAAVTTAAARPMQSASAGAAPQPRIVNGRLTTEAARPPLAQTFRTIAAARSGIAWIGYAVPVFDRERVMCCFTNGSSAMSASVSPSGDWGWRAGVCGLEPSAHRSVSARPVQGPIKLEGPESVMVLFRIVEGRVDRIRTFSDSCELDAGGRPVQWLEGVAPAESLALLETMIAADPDRKERVSKDALGAIAVHADTAAGAMLGRLARRHASAAIRGEALFWIAQRGDRSADAVIVEALERDASHAVRKRAVFALSQLRDERGVPALVQTARTHGEPSVRGEAVFWLAQKAGRRAAAAIVERVENDPETEVKKRAVFALSQLPDEEGVPLLIGVARTNRNLEVRKQAMFWLGQSKDPRAIDFFAEVLK